MQSCQRQGRQDIDRPIAIKSRAFTSLPPPSSRAVTLSNRFHILQNTDETDHRSASDSSRGHLISKGTVTGQVERSGRAHKRLHKSEKYVSDSAESKDITGIEATKCDLGLTGLASKCQALRKAKNATFNRLFNKQNRGFFGFISLSPLPEKI